MGAMYLPRSALRTSGIALDHADDSGWRRSGGGALVENDDQQWTDNASFSIGVSDLDALYEEYRGISAPGGPLERKAWGRREFHMIVPSEFAYSSMAKTTRASENVREVVPFLTVSDIERSVRYYVDGLGFTMKHKWEPGGKLRWCWVALGGAALMLQEIRLTSVKVGEGVALYFICEDAIAIYREVPSARDFGT
jgi:hypothetical protein